MEKYQNSKLSMYAVLVLFFNQYTSIFTSFTKLVTKIADFKSNKILLDAEISNQSTNNTGIAADKNTLVVIAINLLVKFARK